VATSAPRGSRVVPNRMGDPEPMMIDDALRSLIAKSCIAVVAEIARPAEQVDRKEEEPQQAGDK
jgi:hypothetical protein